MEVSAHRYYPNAKLRILGINIDCISYREMMDRFDSWIQSDAGSAFTVALINVNCCVSALLDPKIRRVYQHADMTGLDSMPFLYVARALKNPQSSRLYAPDMMLKLAEHSRERGYKFFLYGGASGAPEAMAEYLKRRFPNVQIAGMYSPPFRAITVSEDDNICKMIRDSGANIVWVGLGSPKQDVWIEEHRPKLPGIVMIAAGATFDFFAGRIRQAPGWIRVSGFEWLYRLFQDPIRLWKRYTVYNVLFLFALGLEVLGLLRLGPVDSAPRRNTT
jgi:N-acetylglucosaminyldiphosphoundecaprenol N-acetyl-beta-D-mannosaminyltransferase